MEFKEFPIINTDRFLLRQMSLDDAPGVLEVLSDKDVTKDMGIRPLTSVEEAEGVISFVNRLFDLNQALRWGIIKKDTNTLIGTCGFNGWEVQRGSRGEVAYDLGKQYWRKGYMTEILTHVIGFGFHEMNLHRIEAFTNIDATPSKEILRKFGFYQEGVLRGYSLINGEYADQYCYSLLKTEWDFQMYKRIRANDRI